MAQCPSPDAPGKGHVVLPQFTAELLVGFQHLLNRLQRDRNREREREREMEREGSRVGREKERESQSEGNITLKRDSIVDILEVCRWVSGKHRNE